MKTSKRTAISIMILLIAVCTLAFAACDPEEVDTGLESAINLASRCDTTSVKLTKGGELYYSFVKTGNEDAVVNDVYGTGVDASAFVDFSKEIKAGFSASDVTVADRVYSEATGAIKLTATFNDAAKILGEGISSATLQIEGNVITYAVSVYKISYTDANGFDVEISLS